MLRLLLLKLLTVTLLLLLQLLSVTLLLLLQLLTVTLLLLDTLLMMALPQRNQHSGFRTGMDILRSECCWWSVQALSLLIL